MSGDHQFAKHASVSNANGLYWKMTKSQADGCSSHIVDAVFADTALLSPDAPGAFIFERVELLWQQRTTQLNAHHHCGVGNTGMLCSATYVLDNVRGKFSSIKDLKRGVVVLAPGNDRQDMFPPGYVAHAEAAFDYLLASPDCVRANTLGGEYAKLFGEGNPSRLGVRLFVAGKSSYVVLNRIDINKP